MAAVPGDTALCDRLARARQRKRIVLLDPDGRRATCAIIEWGSEAAGSAARSGRPAVAAVYSCENDGYAGDRVSDMRAFERTLRGVFDTTEREARLGRVDELLVAVSDRDLGCHYGRGDARVSGGRVDERDMLRSMRRCARPKLGADEVILHALPVHYSLDDRDGIHNPRDLAGQRLTVDMVWITGRRGLLDDLSHCARGCGLRPAGFVARPYAAGLGCNPSTNRRAGGYACIDLGEGCTGVSMFLKGAVVFAGSAAAGRNWPELFQEVKEQLAQAEFNEMPKRSVFLTGPGARGREVEEVATRILNCRVETGQPGGVWWPDEQAAAPESAALVGLARYVHSPIWEYWDYERKFAGGVSGVVQRTFRWMMKAW